MDQRGGFFFKGQAMSDTPKALHRQPQLRVRRVVRRTNEDISNDISEEMPVTPAEVLRILKWERRRSFKLQNTINRLRDAMVKVGLMLANESDNSRSFECLITISRALRARK